MSVVLLANVLLLAITESANVGSNFSLKSSRQNREAGCVRCLTFIPSGSFICEYAGELLEDKEAEQRIGNDEYLFDIGQNYNDSSLKPEESVNLIKFWEEDGFTIDAAQYGNIGRFINHSCSPNLYAQNVIYDHDDKRMPHVMLFAAENIPPCRSLHTITIIHWIRFLIPMEI
ncbi:Histone-lysine N-methyltransferase [Abeliophyllum distichum]|uniref:Histone-lysine N-methyltransferase n=1 Tax=Abeliophyllum distichum TaxID=126358 RepID=A0ABD1NUZ4_9LAMI